MTTEDDKTSEHLSISSFLLKTFKFVSRLQVCEISAAALDKIYLTGMTTEEKPLANEQWPFPCV